MKSDISVRGKDMPPAPPGDLAQLPEPLPLRGMVAFRYASTEVYEQDGQVHVRMKQTRLQDGRLRIDECEGTVDRAACERMVVEAQQQFLAQAFGLARLFLSPFLGLPRRKD